MRNILTEEEKVAKKLITIVSDLRLDLDQVGFYLATIAPSVALRRLSLITETADEKKEAQNVYNL